MSYSSAPAMERRVRAARGKRAQAKKKKEKSLVAKELTGQDAMDDAWATVVYVSGGAGPAYTVAGLHETRAAAEEDARRGTRQALDDAAYLPDRPYSVVFAAPVLGGRGYARGRPYYANLRAAAGGGSPARAVSLWATATEAVAEAVATAPEPDEDRFVYAGGPVQLARKAAAKAACTPPPVEQTKSERRAARLYQKRAARRAAKRGVPVPVPAAEGTAAPTAEGTAAPTAEGTAAPTAEGTAAPTAEGTAAPAQTRWRDCIAESLLQRITLTTGDGPEQVIYSAEEDPCEEIPIRRRAAQAGAAHTRHPAARGSAP